MCVTNRLPRALSTPLPKLMNFLQPLQDQFRHRENRTALERYLIELLTDFSLKNCAILANAVPGTSEQPLQGLLTMMQWDADAVNWQPVAQMLAFSRTSFSRGCLPVVWMLRALLCSLA